MGRPAIQFEPITNHFSHPHPLHLTNPQPSQSCSACRQTLETEPFYTCAAPPCSSYSLHLRCAQLPQRITHPGHHNHPLSLLSTPPVFICNACGKQGDGFSYSCKDCALNIHVLCAKLPLSVSHGSHCHQLSLVFSPPYGPGNNFSCDVCGQVSGSRCWLYRCGLCGFDAHLSCATSQVAQVLVGRGAVSNGPQNLNVNRYVNGGGGGGVGGRDQLLQAIMNGGGGGGGGMDNQLLQTMMGGGGGGGGMSNQLLQAMMGGGGGGGGDVLQALLSGSNGGIGGLDFSSVLGDGGGFGGSGDFSFN